jgi:hypothetical protein
MAKAGVKMELDFETTAEKIQAFKPDILVFAAGGLPFTPPTRFPIRNPADYPGGSHCSGCGLFPMPEDL